MTGIYALHPGPWQCQPLVQPRLLNVPHLQSQVPRKNHRILAMIYTLLFR